MERAIEVFSSLLRKVCYNNISGRLAQLARARL